MNLLRGVIGMVVCPNMDSFHEGVFVRYLIIGGKMIDDPSFQFYMKLLNNYPNCKIEAVVATCRYCKARGCK
jgi:hypothetical protein